MSFALSNIMIGDGNGVAIKDSGISINGISGSSNYYITSNNYYSQWSNLGNTIYTIGSNVGIGTNTALYTLDCLTTDGIRIPKGTTAQRPTLSNDGLIRYNTTSSNYEGYSNNTWGTLGGSSGGTSIINSGGIASNIPMYYIYNPYKFRATMSADQTVLNNTQTVITFNTKTFDTANTYNTTTYKYVIPQTGYYHFNGMITWGNYTDVTGISHRFRNNGGDVDLLYTTSSGTGYNMATFSDIYFCASNDAYYLDTYQSTGSSKIINQGRCYFSGYFISA